MKPIDITDSKLKGKELQQQIEDEVSSTQSVIIQELPSELKMTKAQFDNLQATSGMMNSYIPDYYIYQTKLNVMEIKVVDPPILLGEDDVKED